MKWAPTICTVIALAAFACGWLASGMWTGEECRTFSAFRANGTTWICMQK